MKNVLDVFRERGLIKQVVYEDELYQKLGSEQMTFYIGFDPTADSLHIGHFVQMMTIRHMLNCGHKAILLLGGGTAMVGDPSGKTAMRKFMTKETINYNNECFKKQMGKYIDLSSPNVKVVNNADWLLNLNYIDFLREVGSQFSVNKMLTAECFKMRMEKGLSFLEFNYMLMQAYDFLMLNRNYGCSLQLGGDDQWSNILAGADLIRRLDGKPAFAMTFKLLTTTTGEKMGKTVSGAVWLDREKTTPYEFYQYWRNIEDEKVEDCFNILTFVDVFEIAELVKYKDERMNASKERLAYEITKIIHGEKEAELAQEQSRAAFAGNAELMPTKQIEKCQKVVDCLVACGLANSKGEAKRLIEGGGVAIEEQKIENVLQDIPFEFVEKGEFVLHKGKKIHVKVQFI
ncbi:MAG: tyrosine--tRNA ligase [Clostridia bacterium]